MTKGQLEKYLQKSGVKAEEIEWSGLRDILDENPNVDLDEANEDGLGDSG